MHTEYEYERGTRVTPVTNLPYEFFAEETQLLAFLNIFPISCKICSREQSVV